MKLTRTPEPRPDATPWRGYTLDEIRYQRVLALASIEIEKQAMAVSASNAKEQLPFVGENRGSGLMKILTYIEYGVIAVKLWKRFRSIFKKSRR